MLAEKVLQFFFFVTFNAGIFLIGYACVLSLLLLRIINVLNAVKAFISVTLLINNPCLRHSFNSAYIIMNE